MQKHSLNCDTEESNERIKENEKIISLIKAKLQPLNKHKRLFHKSVFPFIKSKSINRQVQSTHASYDYEDIPILCMDRQTHPQKQTKNTVLDRAKVLLKETYKKINKDKENKETTKLTKYVQLFEPKKYLESKKSKKRIYFEIIPTKKQIPYKSQKKLSSLEVSLMNARLRKKMNHKKLIEIEKYI